MDACESDEDTEDEEIVNVDVEDTFEEEMIDEGQQGQLADARKFEEQQRNDESLKAWWNIAKQKEPGFFIVISG